MSRYFVTVDYQGPHGAQSADAVVEAESIHEASERAINVVKTKRAVRTIRSVRPVLIQPRTGRGAYGRRA